VHEETFSFPSTHAAVTISFYGFIAYLLIRRNAVWKKRVSAFFDVLFVTILIDFSRLYLGVHYFSDVIAGNAVGLAILLTSVCIGEWIIARTKMGKDFSFEWSPLFVVVAVEAVAIASLLFAFPVRWESSVGERDTRAVAEKNVLPLFADGSLPSFAESLFGRQQLPISVIVIGDTRCLLQGLDRAHWRRTDEMSVEATADMIKAIALDQEFSSPPLTPSFYNSYPQDFGFSKDTGTGASAGIDRLRLWQTPFVTEHGPIFAATVTLDRRTKWTLMHSIDPDIDAERTLLLQNLLAARVVQRFRIIRLIPAQQRRTYSTDGKAVLMELRSCPGPSKIKASAP
jgi:undecaprenyl-diphosphatase